MNIVKNEQVSHVTDISDQMLNFINKEGTNSYPTITVLFNRVFLANDQYDWVKNSGIDLEFPTLKEKDDIHWYKTKEIYTNIKNSLNTLLNKCKLFQDTPISDADKSSKYYSSKIRIYRSLGSQIFYKESMESEENECINDLSNDTIKDVLTVGECDFILTRKSIYRIKTNTNDAVKVYTSNNNTLNAFDSNNTYIIVASNSGGLVFSNILNDFVLDDTIKYDIYVSATTGTGVDQGTVSSEQTQSISYTNNLPENNICTFVYFESGNTFSIGNTSTSGRFTVGGSYKASAVDNSGIQVKSENIHGSGVCGIAIPEGYKIKNTVLKTSNHVFSFYSDEYMTLLVTSEGIEVYLNNKNGERETVFTSANNGMLGTVEFIYGEDKNFYIKTTSGVYKTFDVNSTENPITFILFNFIYDEDKDKDKIDMRQAKLSIPEIISLAYDKSVFDKYMKTSLEKNTNFIIAFSKTPSDKTVYHLYGDDNRRNLANEIKMCADFFDIGFKS